MSFPRIPIEPMDWMTSDVSILPSDIYILMLGHPTTWVVRVAPILLADDPSCVTLWQGKTHLAASHRPKAGGRGGPVPFFL